MGWGPFGHVWAPLWMCSREEEQGKETGESEVYPLCLWMVKSRLGWAGKQKAFAHLQGFLLSLLVKQVLYFHVSYFGSCFAELVCPFCRGQKTPGREGRKSGIETSQNEVLDE